MQSGKSGGKLSDMIKKAISDCELTQNEYEEILALVCDDCHVDSQEQNLLNQLQELLSNGTIVKVP